MNADRLAQMARLQGYYNLPRFFSFAADADVDLSDARWYLGIVPPMSPVDRPEAYAKWASELHAALHHHQGGFAQQLFVWKWGRSS